MAIGLTLSALASTRTASATPASESAIVGGGAGMQVLCSQAGYGCTAGTGYAGQGRWGANHGKTGHNCTSYVSYRLSQLGVGQPWHPMGDAGRWDDNARGKVAVDDLPAAGAVAEWEGGTRYDPGRMGHVGYVESVEGGVITVTDDSLGGGTRRVRIETGSPYWPSHFVHIHDLPRPELSVGDTVLGGVRAAVATTGFLTLGMFRDHQVLTFRTLDYVT